MSNSTVLSVTLNPSLKSQQISLGIGCHIGSNFTGTIGTFYKRSGSDFQEIPTTFDHPVLFCDTVYFLTNFVVFENGILTKITKDPQHIIYPLYDKWGCIVTSVDWPPGCLLCSLHMQLYKRIQQHTALLTSDDFNNKTLDSKLCLLQSLKSEITDAFVNIPYSNATLPSTLYKIMKPEELRLSKLIKELNRLV